MSTKSSSSAVPRGKGTVLLRHALPKYSFMATKADEKSQISKPKPENESSPSDTVQIRVTASEIVREKHKSADDNLIKTTRKVLSDPLTADCKSLPAEQLNKTSNQILTESSSLSNKPVSSVTPKVQRVSPSVVKPVATNKFDSKEASPAPPPVEYMTVDLEKPVSRVGPIQSDQIQTGSQNVVSGKEAQLMLSTRDLSTNVVDGVSDDVEHYKQELKRLQREHDLCKSELDVQHKVNGELKRLLVASVGEDLHHKVECLARTKAHLTMEVGDYTKKMYEDYENMDRISIEADMWRSKFFASRFMIDELARAKAFYASHYQESQNCIQQMLNERFELRNHMVDTYRCLQQIKSAFDPLNTQKSVGSSSANVLNLSKNNQQLSDAVKFRLLPGASYNTVDVGGLWEDELTPAEALAEEMLSREISLEDFHHSVPPQLAAPTSLMIERYHPSVKYDNITINCCPQCTGEMKAV